MALKYVDAVMMFDSIEEMAKNGLDDKDIAKSIGVAKQTFCRWKQEHSELSELLKNARVTPIQMVENTLYLKATGQCWVEEITEENGVVTKRVKKQVPPDMAAMSFYLKNKCRGEWRDRWDIAVGNTDDKPFKLDHISTEEIKELLKNED